LQLSRRCAVATRHVPDRGASSIAILAWRWPCRARHTAWSRYKWPSRQPEESAEGRELAVRGGVCGREDGLHCQYDGARTGGRRTRPRRRLHAGLQRRAALPRIQSRRPGARGPHTDRLEELGAASCVGRSYPPPATVLTPRRISPPSSRQVAWKPLWRTRPRIPQACLVVRPAQGRKGLRRGRASHEVSCDVR
jgi:hypothetical protein